MQYINTNTNVHADKHYHNKEAERKSGRFSFYSLDSIHTLTSNSIKKIWYTKDTHTYIRTYAGTHTHR